MAELHKPITGGCLCESVRYTVSFPADAQWPPQAHTCQCTQCRKNTGSLILHFITVPPANVSWALPKPGPQHGAGDSSSSNPTTTFREYASSPGCFRGFCENCGTTLTWRKERNGDEIEIMLGTVDEECLDKELCLPISGQYWCKNFIKDVTDIIPTGDKWLENNGENGVKLN